MAFANHSCCRLVTFGILSLKKVYKFYLARYNLDIYERISIIFAELLRKKHAIKTQKVFHFLTSPNERFCTTGKTKKKTKFHFFH